MHKILKNLPIFLLLAATLGLAACSSTPAYQKAAAQKNTPHTGGTYKIGNPYQVGGHWYYPKEDKNYNEVGTASWYGPQFHQLTTANGEIFDMNELTAAHKTLPLPTYVRVTNLENGRFLIVRVNDRGPFVGDRIIDLSRRAAQLLGFDAKGTTKVRVEVVEQPAPGPAVQEAAIDPKYAGGNLDDGMLMPAVPAPAVEKGQLAALPNDSAGQLNASRQNPQTTQFADNSIGTTGSAIPDIKGEEVFVQAGAFSVYKNADHLAQSLKSHGPVTLSSIKINGHDLYRVRIGPFKTMRDADAILGKIVAHGLNAARIVVD
jgi:rare lipoprotein A